MQRRTRDVATPVVQDSPLRPWGEPDRSAVPALDGLRAVAVLAVLLTHVGFQTGQTLQGQLGAVLARGDFGVTLFFLLSGFLLYRPFVTAHLVGAPAPRLRDFWRNRVLRVLPAYVVLVAVVVPLLSPGRGTGEVVRQGLLLQTLTPGHLLDGLTHTWSLVVEVGFYAVLPALALVVRPRTPRRPEQQLRAELLLLGALAAVALASQVAVHAFEVGPDGVANLWLPYYLDWFALGMLLAVLRAWHALTGGAARIRELATGASGTLVTVGLLLFWLSTTPVAGPRGLEVPTTWEALVKHALYGAAAAALLMPVVMGNPASAWSRLLSTPLARWLGRISYGVFLWHLVALAVVFRVTGVETFDGDFALVLALTLPLSLLLAQVSLSVVELPALRRKRPTTPR